ncbi:dethiobiotin synthase [Segetibacter sp. 3557_3]|uniref:dethiobiotin synthase n=1 Tax=Segetibacter sp. 3557_3 TaxID=2547429 RepID=UPI001058655D|nr:dethiobiotin synthase [Segetibacter sp. 3557_3]TDH29177.1 dethiobiotin synthase [Segetibacter sp. 3557_3]
MNKPIFVTGIGTSVGKTLVAAAVSEALQADYWKPIQAGFGDDFDSVTVGNLVSNGISKVHHEFYKLSMRSSPHLAAEKDNVRIDLSVLERSFRHLSSVNPHLVIEGAGGLMVPLNEKEFVADLIAKLDARVIIVSRNYLGSINHSLLTAQLCRQRNLNILGWVFNDEVMGYEEDIVKWSGYPSLGRIPFTQTIDKAFISEHAEKLKPQLERSLQQDPAKKPNR